MPAILQPEQIEDSIPLTQNEKILKEKLESVVENGIEQFLRTGAALAELRNKRLYRTEFGTFEAYVQIRFGLHRSRVDALIRSSSVAQSLLDHGVEFSPTTNEASVRPLCGLPDNDDLRAEVWEFVQNISPQCGPTSPLVARVCRTIRNVLNGTGEDSAENEPTTDRAGYMHLNPRKCSTAPLTRERMFLAPAVRLATYQSFSPQLVVAQINGPDQAATAYRACTELVDRLHAVQNCLRNSFPEVLQYSDHNTGVLVQYQYEPSST